MTDHPNTAPLAPEPAVPVAGEDRRRRRAAALPAGARGTAVVAWCGLVVAAIAGSGSGDEDLRRFVAGFPPGAVFDGVQAAPSRAGSGSGAGSSSSSGTPGSPGSTGAAVPSTAATGVPASSGTAGTAGNTGAVTLTAAIGAGSGRPARQDAEGSPVSAAEGNAGTSLTLDGGEDGLAPTLSVTNTRPGTTGTMTLRVRNTGGRAAPLRITTAGLTEQPGLGAARLSERLVLRIAGAGGALGRGVLVANAGPTVLGTVPPRSSRTWRVELTFPDGGVPPSPTAGDNRYQGASAGFRLEITEGA